MATQAARSSGFNGVQRSDRPATVAIAAGPFDLPSPRAASEPTLSDALLTGLLVVYPVIATVCAVVVGLSIAGPVV